MLEFILLLKQRYQTILESQFADENLRTLYQGRIDTLILAEAFIRKGLLLASIPDHPLQIAVIGPTQAGKSTVTNLLLGTAAAGVSPLAGFTVHPQGFCSDPSAGQCPWLDEYFDHFQRLPHARLDKNRPACYALTKLENHQVGLLPPCILWDTPDFDSIDAASYREGVLRTAALADVLLVVVSKEKYADQSVWETLGLLEPLQQPTLILVNKLTENARSAVLHSLQEKWCQARSDAFPEVLSLPYQRSTAPAQWPARELEKALKQLSKTARKNRLRTHFQCQQRLLTSHWDSWLEPVLAEHAALAEWEKLVAESIRQALANYHRDYLDHPHHYETFQNALAELLTLLEIPGLARVLVQTRKVLTWPVKQMIRLGKAGFGQHRDLTDGSQEIVLLRQIAEHLLIQLADRLLDKIEQEPEKEHWWKALNAVLRRQRNAVLAAFQTSANNYHAEFHEEVESVAHRLYAKLQEQPLTLNSLRATRATTDAAAVALALQAGGIGLHDLIITPAMLSVSSLLAESAIGGYMKRVEAEMKLKQLHTVKHTLFLDPLQAALLTFPKMLDRHLSFNISPQLLHDAEQQLKTEKKHGLRML